MNASDCAASCTAPLDAAGNRLEDVEGQRELDDPTSGSWEPLYWGSEGDGVCVCGAVSGGETLDAVYVTYWVHGRCAATAVAVLTAIRRPEVTGRCPCQQRVCHRREPVAAAPALRYGA